MPEVEIPELGVVQFPDSMSRDEINAKAKELYTNRVSIKARKRLEALGPGSVAPPNASPLQQKAAANIRGNELGQTHATYDQEIADIKGRGYGMAAAAVPLAAAGVLTAGASIPESMAIMGGLGVAGGLARENVKASAGSSEIPQTMGELAKTLGVDAATGMLAEGVGQGVGALAKSILPRIVIRSANKDQYGRTVLGQAVGKIRSALFQNTGNTAIDVTGSYSKVLNELDSLPSAAKGAGSLEARLLQLSKEAGTTLSDVGKDVGLHGGGLAKSTQVPLDNLIVMRGKLNQEGWDLANGLTVDERPIIQRFADNLDKDIKAGLKVVGGTAEQLYNAANNIWKIQRRNQVGTVVVEESLKRMSARMVPGALGGAAGGIEGYRRGGLGGAAAGVVAGGMAGAALGATRTIPPKVSAWVIDYLSHNPKTITNYMKAVDFYTKGDEANAYAAMSHAITTAGIREHIKDMIRHPEEIAPTETPTDVAPIQP